MLQTLVEYDSLSKENNYLFDMSTSYNAKRKNTDDFNSFQNYSPWSNGGAVLSMHKQYDLSADSPTMHGVETNHNGIDSTLFSTIPGSSKDSILPPVSPTHLDSTNSSVYLTSDHSDTEVEEAPKKKRNPVPDFKKDDRYWQRRQKNNMAAKRSREMKKRKVEDELHQAREALAENAQLKQEVEVLKAEISSLRRLLKDANMTLSLWIKARQASEMPSKLPPMMRNPTNMPYVTFPVTTSNLP